MSPPPNVLCVLDRGSGETTAPLRRLCALAGIETTTVRIEGNQLGLPCNDDLNGRSFALSAETLAQVIDQTWFSALLDSAPFCLMYGFDRSPEMAAALSRITDSRLTGIAAPPGGPHVVKVLRGPVMDPLPVAGQSYVSERSSGHIFATNSEDDRCERLISLNDGPYFVRLRRGGANVFLLGEREFVDCDHHLEPGQSLRPWYPQIIALWGFLRHAFGAACWQAPQHSATLIIDDPDLQPNYGFVEYRQLLPQLERYQCALTIAFIPHNVRRSDPATVALLKGSPDRLSIALHGCDHTRGEYASGSEDWLACKTEAAQGRMNAHTASTGLPFDNVMVFPQGLFSVAAMRAVKKSGILAAVNSTPWPTTGLDRPMTIGDLLSVAVTCFDNFPLFLRRYPKDPFGYAFDAMLGKPVIAVEHHEYFRPGYGPLTRLVSAISAIPNVQWMPLERALSSSCLVRRRCSGKTEVRFFTHTFRFTNSTREPTCFEFEKRDDPSLVRSVLRGAQPVPFSFSEGDLRISVVLKPGEDIELVINYHPVRQSPCTTRCHHGCHGPAKTPNRESQRRVWRPTATYRAGVTLRRLLCDFRDNHLARNERLHAMAQSVRQWLLRWQARSPAPRSRIQT